jgi:putative transposase
VVWCPKYREPILTGNIHGALKSELEKQCSERGWEIISLETQPEHIHLFFAAVDIGLPQERK